jgi:hypothetical protein
MNRALKCNQVNDAGDEVWNDLGVGSTTGNTCGAYPSTTSSIPVSTRLGASSYQVKVTLMADAWIYGIVTDANGCSKKDSVFIHAEDVRCFAGKDNKITKVQMCHQTGDPKTKCVTICVDSNAVAEHLAHGDFVGKCGTGPSACVAPNQLRTAQSLGDHNTNEKLSVKILPNPSVMGTDFTLTATGKTSQDVQIRVLNMLGKTVYSTMGAANQTYKFGGNFISGIYIVEVIQGTDVQRVKVVKQ